MSDGVGPLAAFALLGALLAAAYFGGLWWTVRRLPTSGRPWLLYFASMLIRLGLLLGALFLILRVLDDWKPLVACSAGFLVARLVLVHWARPRRESPAASAGKGA